MYNGVAHDRKDGLMETDRAVTEAVQQFRRVERIQRDLDRASDSLNAMVRRLSGEQFQAFMLATSGVDLGPNR